MTTTTVTGRVVRSISLDTFADITDAPLAPGGIRSDGLTFDGDLTDEQQTAIWARMESRDDTDQARRAVLRDACTNGATNVDCLTAAYVLGDPLPSPTSPPA